MVRGVALSFSGSGHLMVYQLGVARTLMHPNSLWSERISHFLGSSGGALAATLCSLVPPHALDSFVQNEALHGKTWQGLLQALNVSIHELVDAPSQKDQRADRFKNLRREPADGQGQNAQLTLTEQSVIAASNRLFIGATPCKTGRHMLLSRFRSRHDLAKCLLASCAIPRSAHPFDLLRTERSPATYPEMDGVVVPPQCAWDASAAAAQMRPADGSLPYSPHGIPCVDGGLSAAAPMPPAELQERTEGSTFTLLLVHTLSVTPISGPQGCLSAPDAQCTAHYHLCPIDTSVRVPLIAPRLAGMRCYLSVDNLQAATQSLGPSHATMERWYSRGCEDAERLLAAAPEPPE